MKSGKVQSQITTAVLKEQQLNLLDACIANLSDIVLITEADPIDEPGPRIVFVNDAFTRLTGYTQEEALGRSPRFLQGEKTDRTILGEIREALRNRQPIRRQVVNYGKDGSEHWLDIDMVPIFDKEGQCTHFAAIERDITREKNKEDSLRLFRTLINECNDAIEAVAPETAQFLEFNDIAHERLGYTREEMLGLKVTDIFVPEKESFSFKGFVEEIKKNGGRIVQGWHVRKDGSRFPIEANVRYLELDRGYFITVVRDISDRKESENELLGKSAFFEAKVNSSLDAVLVVDNRGKKILQNQQMNDLWNIPEELTKDENDSRQLEWVASQIKNPGPFAEKVAWLYAHPDEISRDEIELKSGKILDRYSAPVRGKDGKLYGRIWSFRDITERKAAEERIREQAALLEKARDAIMVRDLNGTILFWNKGSEDIYGWSPEEAVGKNIGQLLYQDPKKFDEINGLALSEGEWHGELQQITKDLRTLNIEARWTLIRDNEGQPKSVFAINTDITERKKIESQFMRAQRMESIGTLAGGIAHDLNNILGPILLSIELLRITKEPARTQNILNTIELSARRGADIVRQVLSFARGLDGERTRIDPRELLNDLERIVHDTFPKNIRLHFSVSGKICPIFGDPTQVHQILLNLSVNARDAMPKGGSLSVHAEKFVADSNFAAMHLNLSPGRYVRLRVTDSGKGIPPEMIDKIFEPFFTTKDVKEGTGLGLSTVMAIVKSHGGTVDVDSKPGAGTTFQVYLPAAEPSDSDKHIPEQAALLEGKGETILIVDDEASILSITGQTLESFGYRVLTAKDGADGVATYVEHRAKIDVVLIDMMMPIMDGQSAVQALKRLSPGIKIIGSSGLTSNKSVTTITGIKHFLTKPYTAEVLLSTLRAILEEP